MKKCFLSYLLQKFAKICEKYNKDNIRLPVSFDNIFEAKSVSTSS